jgi:hypothetical protein
VLGGISGRQSVTAGGGMGIEDFRGLYSLAQKHHRPRNPAPVYHSTQRESLVNCAEWMIKRESSAPSSLLRGPALLLGSSSMLLCPLLYLPYYHSAPLLSQQ